MERVIAALSLVVLVSLPFVGWQTGWQTTTAGPVNILSYLLFSALGWSKVLTRVRAKHFPDSKLIKTSALLALLFTPLLLEMLVSLAGVH